MNSRSVSSLSVSSSVKLDSWHPDKRSTSYEWWYFDALSDDGRDALVIVFIDNFIFSPRHNDSWFGSAAKANSISIDPSKPVARYPAVYFTYLRDGKVVYKALSEYSDVEFSASQVSPQCTLGLSHFIHRSTEYGSGYSLSLHLPIGGGKILNAEFEWLSIESDLLSDNRFFMPGKHCWNVSVPRADVSGKITVVDETGEEHEHVSFRGTGYHDHTIDDMWDPAVNSVWHRGRFHFSDMTLVFCRFEEFSESVSDSRLFLVKNGEMQELAACPIDLGLVRDRNGISYPRQIEFSCGDSATKLQVKPLKVLDSSFFYLRMLTAADLTTDEGETHTVTGLSEVIVPKFVRHKWLNWITSLNVRRK